MREFSLAQKYAIIGLDGVESTHSSAAKNVALRAVEAAKLLEEIWLPEESADPSQTEQNLQEGLKRVKASGKKEQKKLEEEITEALRKADVLEEVPDLLACDMDYDTAGVDIKVYRSDAETYQRIVEEIRAEILEEGPITAECAAMLWLLRESGRIYDVFAAKEQEKLAQRMREIAENWAACRILWEQEFHSSLEIFVQGFLSGKKKAFKNQYLEGINLMFPFLERRQAIFIDFVILGTTVANRRQAIMMYLSERGHFVQEVKNGTETLLKIDNSYYRVFPATKRVARIPIQGANLVPVYF